MNIYEVIVITTFVMGAIIIIFQYIDTNALKVGDILELMNILPYYEIKAYRDGKRLYYYELIKYINRPVKDIMVKDDVLYIEIY